MPYQTGAAGGYADVLDKLAIFIGLYMPTWTVEENHYVGDHYEIYFHKGNTHITAAYDDSSSTIISYPSYTGALDPNIWNRVGRPFLSGNTSQPLYAVSETNVEDLTNTYHFFSDGINYVHVVIEIIPNYYTHMSFGQAPDQVNPGNLDRGYLFATRWSQVEAYRNNPAHNRNGKVGLGSAEFITDAGMFMGYKNASEHFWFVGCVTGVNLGQRIQAISRPWFDTDWYQFIQRAGASLSNQSTIMPYTPLVLNGINSICRPHCTIPDFGFVDLEYYEIGQEVQIGSDVWIVFPWRSKYVNTYSRNFGYAYKKLV